MTRREVNIALVALAVAVVLAVLFTRALLPDPNPPLSATAAAAPASVAAQGGVSAELLGELATGYECRQAARAFVKPAADERKTWEEHAEAHHKWMTGEITQDERNRRWKVTLTRRLVEDPVFGQAWGAVVAACGQATTGGATTDHSGHTP